MEARLAGKGPVGRPRKRYEATINEAADRLLGITDRTVVSNNRQHWSNRIAQEKDRIGP